MFAIFKIKYSTIKKKNLILNLILYLKQNSRLNEKNIIFLFNSSPVNYFL